MSGEIADYETYGGMEAPEETRDPSYCLLHNVTMFGKDGQYGKWYSHILKDVGFCNGTKIKPFKDGVRTANSLPPRPTNTATTPVHQANRNEDQIAKGKVRFGYVNTILRVQGLVALSEEDKKLLEALVDYTMTGE